MAEKINDVHCTHCHAVYDGEEFKKLIPIMETFEYQCKCGKYIDISNKVEMKWTMSYTSAYDKPPA